LKCWGKKEDDDDNARGNEEVKDDEDYEKLRRSKKIPVFFTLSLYKQ
jgi:hypothetical protein